MSLTKITLEGTADLSINQFVCVCSFCGNHDSENARVELNFRDKKIFYSCKQCKEMNSISLEGKHAPPLPSIKSGR